MDTTSQLDTLISTVHIISLMLNWIEAVKTKIFSLLVRLGEEFERL